MPGNLTTARPRLLFDYESVGQVPQGNRFGYAVTGDGQRFLVNEFVDDAPPATMNVIVNWPASLRRQQAGLAPCPPRCSSLMAFDARGSNATCETVNVWYT